MIRTVSAEAFQPRGISCRDLGVQSMVAFHPQCSGPAARPSTARRQRQSSSCVPCNATLPMHFSQSASVCLAISAGHAGPVERAACSAGWLVAPPKRAVTRDLRRRTRRSRRGGAVLREPAGAGYDDVSSHGADPPVSRTASAKCRKLRERLLVGDMCSAIRRAVSIFGSPDLKYP